MKKLLQIIFATFWVLFKKPVEGVLFYDKNMPCMNVYAVMKKGKRYLFTISKNHYDKYIKGGSRNGKYNEILSEAKRI